MEGAHLDLYARGLALYQQARWQDAVTVFAQVPAEHPNYGEALHLQGVCWLQSKQFASAIPALQLAAEYLPTDASVHSNLGMALRSVKRPLEALAAYDKALLLKPGFTQAWANRGNLLRDLGRAQDAAQAYRQALQHLPSYAQAQHGLGLALSDLKQWAESLAAFDAAISLVPEYAMAWLDRGNTLRELEQFEQALQSYDRALALQPDDAKVWSNRGVVLKRLGALPEAAASYTRAIELDPEFVDAMVNFATLLKDMLRLEEAQAMNLRALALAPNNSGAHLNLAICQLVQGDFGSGFAHYEWRWQTEQLQDGLRPFEQPLWTGQQDIRGHTVLLHAEQGLGDTLQFCQLAKKVKAHGATVILEVQTPLMGILQGLEGVDQFLERGAALPKFDLHCPLLSVPLALQLQVHDLPIAGAYLRASAVAQTEWQERLGSKTGLRVGLAWSGRPEHKNDHNRSISLAQFRSLLVPGARYHSLQKEFRSADLSLLHSNADIAVWAEHLHSFSDTAGLASAMDLVIAVDTSVAHLAAAMGKPVWLLLPFSPDWRWIVGRSDSPWYPGMRLFRQPAPGDWVSVIQEVRLALDQISTSHGDKHV
jgi:tetratricopeptide (TPR) repeat protein